jgi:tetratricopeptide (TPR) repeat protein
MIFLTLPALTSSIIITNNTFEMPGKLVWLMLLGLSLNLSSVSANSGDDSIIHKLDKMIIERSIYQERLEKEISDLQRTLEYANDNEFRFNVLGDIFEKYRSFLVDTAFVIAKQRMKIAKCLKKDQQDESLMNMADALNKMGRHRDALAILNKMQRTPYVLHNTYFYYLYHTIYLSCYDEEIDPGAKKTYYQYMKSYKDTLISISPPNSASYIMNKCGLMNMNGKQAAALTLLKTYYEKSGKDNPDRARMEYLMSELYLAKGDTANAKHYLILSSITDIGNAKKVYMSLQRLATILYKQGDIERAYNYITCALEDINFGKARYRILDIVQYLPIINAANNLRVAKNKTRIIYFSLLLFALTSMLVVALIFINKKNIKLVKAQQSLEEQNKCLHEMTNNLAQMNRQIKESNHIKE